MQYTLYTRVSTQQQGASGLGLEAQRAAVQRYAADITAEFTEIESGKKANRLQLAAAIAHCKQSGNTLLIAKLDRLSRDVVFIFTLRDSGINFVCADMPEANTLTIGILAVMAQHERELISQRTKAALSAKKARVGKIHAEKGSKGFENLIASNANAKAGEALRRKAANNEHTQQAAAFAVQLRQSGKSLRQIAAALNAGKFKTARGVCGKYGAVQVLRLLERSEKYAQIN